MWSLSSGLNCNNTRFPLDVVWYGGFPAGTSDFHWMLIRTLPILLKFYLGLTESSFFACYAIETVKSLASTFFLWCKYPSRTAKPERIGGALKTTYFQNHRLFAESFCAYLLQVQMLCAIAKSTRWRCCEDRFQSLGFKACWNRIKSIFGENMMACCKLFFISSGTDRLYWEIAAFFYSIWPFANFANTTITLIIITDFLRKKNASRSSIPAKNAYFRRAVHRH